MLNPTLDGYIKSIKQRMPNANIDSIIINHPDALEYLAKSKYLTKTMLNADYCAKVKDYKDLLPASSAIDRLREENKILYNNIHVEKTSQEQLVPEWGEFFKRYRNTTRVGASTSWFLGLKCCINSLKNPPSARPPKKALEAGVTRNYRSVKNYKVVYKDTPSRSSLGNSWVQITASI
jgi:hypothetical protein